MPFGREPLLVPEGMRSETDRKVERLEFEEDVDNTFVVLHFEAPMTGRATNIRVPITREVYDAR